MMKSSMLILILMLVSVSLCADYLKIPRAEFIEKKKTFLRECMLEKNVDPDEELLSKKIRLIDPIFSDYRVCLASKMDYINEDGDVQEEKIKEEIHKVFHKDMAEKLFPKCIAQKETREKTVDFMFDCMYNILPPLE